jgi:hypothetical protein
MIGRHCEERVITEEPLLGDDARDGREDARPAPICSEGSSGPSDWPLPIASADAMNLPITVLNEMNPS